MTTLHWFFFDIYPYIALSVFFLVSLVRFDRDQYTWKSDSSQLLRHGELRWGSNLFHFGILFVFFGHLVGFLVPESLVDKLMTPAQHGLLAMIAGGVAGAFALVGLTLLMHRRLRDRRIHANTRYWDFGVLGILWIQLVLGLWTIYFSSAELGGATFQRLVAYVQGIIIFRTDNSALLTGLPWVYQAHIVLGLTVFLIFPFTRLAHIWSGFATIAYLFRAPLIIRTRGRTMRADFPVSAEMAEALPEAAARTAIER